MDSLDFIHDSVSDLSNATLKVVLPDGQVCHISDNINPYRLIDNCPLLFHAFEIGHRSHLQASIDAPSKSAAIALLRYCYTGSYLNPCVNDEHVTLLLHVHLYKTAVEFDLPELQLQAHGSFTCHMEAAACLREPPPDLLDTIRFLYQYFADEQSRHQHGLVATLRNYCISTYAYHKLGDNEEFLELVAELPAFGRDLCRTNFERDFEDECASAIICLPPNHTSASQNGVANTPASRALPDQELYDASPTQEIVSVTDEYNNTFEKLAGNCHQNDTVDASVATLVHRPRVTFSLGPPSSDHDLSSDEDGFTVVHRPKAVPHHGAHDESMSSPELVPSVPLNVLAATGGDYPSDDEEWTMW
ncbi:hypothetical protein NX059_006366 [Plenodomus lindquistii]|nr:hypothetical protein NX059_006366 [Plenodomus lindquistii]